ncbi:hypothetical protein [Streptomyces sp. BF23-19]
MPRPTLPAEELTRSSADPSEHVATTAAGIADPPLAHVHRILALAGR